MVSDASRDRSRASCGRRDRASWREISYASNIVVSFCFGFHKKGGARTQNKRKRRSLINTNRHRHQYAQVPKNTNRLKQAQPNPAESTRKSCPSGKYPGTRQLRSFPLRSRADDSYYCPITFCSPVGVRFSETEVSTGGLVFARGSPGHASITSRE